MKSLESLDLGGAVRSDKADPEKGEKGKQKKKKKEEEEKKKGGEEKRTRGRDRKAHETRHGFDSSTSIAGGAHHQTCNRLASRHSFNFFVLSMLLKYRFNTSFSLFLSRRRHGVRLPWGLAEASATPDASFFFFFFTLLWGSHGQTGVVESIQI